MTVNSTTIGRVAPPATTRFENAERISSPTHETRSSFFENAGRYAVKTAAITTAVALPALAIANGMGMFSSGQDTYAQEPISLGHNYTMTLPVVETSSACVQNLALGFLGSLITQSFWPTLAGLFSFGSGAAAQSGSSSESGPLTVACGPTNLTYTIGQAGPTALSSSLTFSPDNAMLSSANLSRNYYSCNDYSAVTGTRSGPSYGWTIVTNFYDTTFTPTAPLGRLASAGEVQRLLRSLIYITTATSPAKCTLTLNAYPADGGTPATCNYTVNVVATPLPPTMACGPTTAVTYTIRQAPVVLNSALNISSPSGSLTSVILNVNNACSLGFRFANNTNCTGVISSRPSFDSEGNSMIMTPYFGKSALVSVFQQCLQGLLQVSVPPGLSIGYIPDTDFTPVTCVVSLYAFSTCGGVPATCTYTANIVPPDVVKSNVPLIAGAAVGGVAAIGGAAGLAYWYKNKKEREQSRTGEELPLVQRSLS